MQNVHPQYISEQKVNNSANLHSGFFIKAKVSRMGTNPSTQNKAIPGIKKFLKGELSNIDNGIPNNSPDGEIINTAPPKIAPAPSSANKESKIYIYLNFVSSLLN